MLTQSHHIAIAIQNVHSVQYTEELKNRHTKRIAYVMCALYQYWNGCFHVVDSILTNFFTEVGSVRIFQIISVFLTRTIFVRISSTTPLLRRFVRLAFYYTLCTYMYAGVMKKKHIFFFSFSFKHENYSTTK